MRRKCQRFLILVVACIVAAPAFAQRGAMTIFEQIQKVAWLTRTWGDCYGYLLVAIGRAELMVDGSLSPWDAAALQVAVEEAGGVFTDWGGRATAFSDGAVATNAVLAPALRRELGIPG